MVKTECVGPTINIVANHKQFISSPTIFGPKIPADQQFYRKTIQIRQNDEISDCSGFVRSRIQRCRRKHTKKHDPIEFQFKQILTGRESGTCFFLKTNCVFVCVFGSFCRA